MAACPASIDIPGVMRRLEAGNLSGARRAAKGNACASCAAIEGSPPCEKVCTRRDFAPRPVAIRDIVSGAAAPDRRGLERARA